jgi:type IV pilus biogenesis protein CpaD/CtpE
MKGAQLPPSVLAASHAKGKDPAALDQAISDLRSTLVQNVQIPDGDLEKLGERRAQAIEDLLAAGGVDPTRVFVVKEQHENKDLKTTPGKVPVEMALK